MTLVNFALVVLGENFPVTTLDLRDFEFRHRKLRETLRLPLIMQAESDSVRLQVLAERFEIAVTRPDRVDVQVEGVTAMVEGLFEYVGPKAISAIGHNAVFRLDGSAPNANAYLNSLVDMPAVEGVLLSTIPVVTQQHFFFRRGHETQARVSLGLTETGEVAFDFNFHYDLKSSESNTTARSAIGRMAESLQAAEEMVGSFEMLFQRVRVA